MAKSAIPVGPHLKMSQRTARWNRIRVVFGMYDKICLKWSVDNTMEWQVLEADYLEKHLLPVWQHGSPPGIQVGLI